MTSFAKGIGIAAFIALIASPAVAQSETAHQSQVLGCFSEIGSSTSWEGCMGVLFSPCAELDFGSDTHVACLELQRDEWRAAKLGVEGLVLADLTEDGLTELSGLMLAWPKFVQDKCTAIAESREGLNEQAVQLGCQVSEIALMTNELKACRENRSNEAYCQKNE